ncbi:MAG TPA: DUF2911 domain-containing protein [Thermoanaerobaculia bacterium]|nr:DUF2911 domain-containing protein [Thermoanaerobaculia bacterium]
MIHRLPASALLAAVLAAPSLPALAAQGLTLPPNGENPQASVTQAIGPVRVTIDYSSPRVVRGTNDRRGKIWGELVPYGLSDLGLNGCTSCPWRAGANENTTFTTTHDVKVQGRPLPAGTYGLHMIPGKDEWTVVFSKDAASWGSYWYDPKNDALRVATKAVKGPYREWLTYEFVEREPAKATVALEWEELSIPLTVAVDDVNQLWVEGMRKDLRQWSGFFWQSWVQAAQFCAQQKVNLPEALAWAERATKNDGYVSGEENFTTLSTLARLQALNGKETDAEKTFQKALEHRTAGPIDIHQAGRRLLQDGKKEEALRVFQLNAKRYPNQWPVHVGLMRGYAAVGQTKKALEEAKLAIAQAPDDPNRKSLEAVVKRLEKGEKID